VTLQATKRLSFRLFETYFDPGADFAAGGASKRNYFGVLSNYRF
jgi:hypothetical protein